MITNDKMKLIWRKKTLEIIPNEVKKEDFFLNNILFLAFTRW
jgi:hypothetical protein